jgi:hypothetical protein
VHFGGVTSHPPGSGLQQARNLAITLEERFETMRFLIHDRGSNFTASFDAVFEATGARILRSAAELHFQAGQGPALGGFGHGT